MQQATKEQIQAGYKGLHTLQAGIDGVLETLSADDARNILKVLSIKLRDSREDIVKHETQFKENSKHLDLIAYFDALTKCQGEISMSRTLLNVIEKGSDD